MADDRPRLAAPRDVAPRSIGGADDALDRPPPEPFASSGSRYFQRKTSGAAKSASGGAWNPAVRNRLSSGKSSRVSGRISRVMALAKVESQRFPRKMSGSQTEPRSGYESPSHSLSSSGLAGSLVRGSDNDSSSENSLLISSSDFVGPRLARCLHSSR